MQAPFTDQTWVLLRGLTRGAGHWGSFRQTLQMQLPGARVVTLDTAGNGARWSEPSAWRVADMAQDCRAQLQAAGLVPPFNLLAMSLGGMVAAQWAIRWPHEIRHMVLVGTSMRPLSPFYERLRPANYRSLLELTLQGASDVRWEQEILRMTTNHPGEAVLARWVAMRSRNPVSAANAVRQLFAAASFRLPGGNQPYLPDAANKVLLLAGEKDGLVSSRCTAALSAHWKCPVVMHPTAGHDVPLDDGPWVAEQVRRWLEAAKTPPALSEPD